MGWTYQRGAQNQNSSLRFSQIAAPFYKLHRKKLLSVNDHNLPQLLKQLSAANLFGPEMQH